MSNEHATQGERAAHGASGWRERAAADEIVGWVLDAAYGGNPHPREREQLEKRIALRITDLVAELRRDRSHGGPPTHATASSVAGSGGLGGTAELEPRSRRCPACGETRRTGEACGSIVCATEGL